MSSSVLNRPFKWGERDRREFIVQDSEVAYRAQNNGNGDPIYVGRAKVGTTDAEAKWQIWFVEYDGNNAVDSITWPQVDGIASSDYQFVWDDRAAYTFS